MIPVLVECTEECPCGEVACERDLVYVNEDEADDLDVQPGDMVCRECAQAAGEAS